MMKFKNDKERLAFLADYRNTDTGWYKWMEIEDIDRVFWRFDLFTCAFVVEEQLRTSSWPDKHEIWTVVHWYIVEDWRKPFADAQSSRTDALIRLKTELKGGSSA